MSVLQEPVSVRIERTVRIVAAYVGNNHVARTDIAGLIGTVFDAVGPSSTGQQRVVETSAPVPAVPIKKSITPDFIICLEDGKSFKSMKRHLASKFNITPDEYRRKWGLPSDYPMVAANYAAKRSELAVKLGLGRKADTPSGAAPVAAKPTVTRKPKLGAKAAA